MTGSGHPYESLLDALALIDLHAAVLFTFDQHGRLAGTNEPEPERPPLIYLGITEEGFVRHYRDDLPRRIVRACDRFLDSLVERPDPSQLPAMILQVCGLLESYAPFTTIGQGPAWRFPESIPEPQGVIAIGPENVDLLRAHFPYTAEHLAAREPCFAVIERGHAVSVCYSARVSPLVTEAGVDTIEAFRGRGYAGNVVAAWARSLRAASRIPLYSASGDNMASRAVARKLGLVMYGIDLSIT